uniref:CS domain-containing protein n=1 Tax=Peronospora matthiolae TaxID=2874970 RepID=A0AAV1TSZ5_9STRA
MSETFFVLGGYVSLVTPWGQVKLNKGFLEQLALSVAVVVMTVMLWRFSARVNATLKKETVDKALNGEEEMEEDDDEEEEKQEREDVMSGPDEKRIKRGENSYFYAHEHLKANDDRTTVSSYGWSDSKKTIRIYLTDDVVMNMKEEQLKLDWTNMSLSMDLLKASGGDRAKSLVIQTLFQEITDVTWESEKDTLTIVLTKAQEMPWRSLNGAAKHMEDHIEYDDAFYN